MPGFLDILNAIGPYAQAGGELAGAISANRGKGRADQAVVQEAYDRNAINRYAQEQNALVNAAQLAENIRKDRADRELTSGKTRAQQVALGELLQNYQPLSIGGVSSRIPVVKFGGGLQLGSLARQAGGTLARDALLAQLNKSDVPMTPDLAAAGLGATPPALTDIPQPGATDTLLNTIATIGGVGGVISEGQRAAEERRARLAGRTAPILPGDRAAAYNPDLLRVKFPA